MHEHEAGKAGESACSQWPFASPLAHQTPFHVCTCGSLLMLPPSPLHSRGHLLRHYCDHRGQTPCTGQGHTHCGVLEAPRGFCKRHAGQSCYTHFNLPWKKLPASNACISLCERWTCPLALEYPFYDWPFNMLHSSYWEASQLNLNGWARLPHLLIRKSNSASYIATYRSMVALNWLR